MVDNVLITIAARGGSKGVKNKNIRDLNGFPLIAHTICQAKKWGKANKIICSTDSQVIANIAKKYGAEVPFLRPNHLAQDDTGKIDVLRHALQNIEEINKKKYSIIIDLDATAPIRKISDIEGAYDLFIEKTPKSVFSVVKSRKNPYFNMVEVNKNGYVKLSKTLKSTVKRRQDAPVVYDMNASIYVYNRDYLLNNETKSAISENSIAYVMDDISAVDIDNEIDFLFVEYLVTKGIVEI